MESTKKVRLILLAVAGVLLVGGVVAWVQYTNSKSEQAVTTTNKRTSRLPATGLKQAQSAVPAVKPVVATVSSGQLPAKPTAPANKVATLPGLPVPSVVPLPVQINQPPAQPDTATTLADAVIKAKKGAGRNDPMQCVTAYLPFPRTKENMSATGTNVPPPVGQGKGKGKLPQLPKEKLLNKELPPPPPPLPRSSGDHDGLPVAALPTPPSKPTLADKLRLIGVIEDRAMFTFPMALRLKNHWPNTVTLGPGEQFESVSVVSVARDCVTLDEDGERSVKSLASVR